MPAPCFADLLDAAIAATRRSAARSAAWARPALTAHRDPLFGARPLPAGAAWARAYPPRFKASRPRAPMPADAEVHARTSPPVDYAPTSGRPSAEWPRRHELPPPAPTAARRRALTPAQQRALAMLLDQGATLAEWFTLEELRREYRRIALRCHPDRHRQAPERERVRMADAFRAATDAYRCLRGIAETRP